jgi:hypothetical protein
MAFLQTRPRVCHGLQPECYAMDVMGEVLNATVYDAVWVLHGGDQRLLECSGDRPIAHLNLLEIRDEEQIE